MVIIKYNSDHARKITIRLRYVIGFVLVIGTTFFLFLLSNNPLILFMNENYIKASLKPYTINFAHSDGSFTIKTEGCTIPQLQAFDESIKKFIERPKHIKQCENFNTSFLENNRTHIWINHKNLRYFNLTDSTNITCCYKSFYRPLAIDDISSADIDDRVKYNDCIEFTSFIEVTNEFVKVSCVYEYTTIYEQFFAFTPKKPLLNVREDINEEKEFYNVIVMGIDAISRLNFHRTMPRTLAFLKKRGAIELLGYNKVGDNTFPNLVPMLLGIREQDLKNTCWPNTKSTFDYCPFIWNAYKDAGYYTAFGEDSASLGTFNFEKFGFIQSPVDYYLHTFMHEAERYSGNNRDFNSYICMGNVFFYKVLLDYIENLTNALKSMKFFGLFWEITMSHDYLNYPMLMDDSYEEFLITLDNSGTLENTVLILLSDHGIRWGDIRFTKQGRLEERLPFIHILLPPSFRENYREAYKNMYLNSHRLTTPFDIHATLIDLVNLESINDNNIQLRSSTQYTNARSISLFLSIPDNRTCKAAGIEDHWCTCNKGIKLSTHCAEGRQAADYLVTYLNRLVSKNLKCIKLFLKEIMEVTEMIVGSPNEKEVGWREFLIVVRVSPSDAVFEATLRQNNNNWSLTGTVSRLNLYGEQSICEHNYQLKLYCYCQL
ncbi:unnamed protein product [Pieris brassicae]|uniref:Uncharacterized protein n=1 Tax=Pieris brassicae TaxID=7116 RepID=A0A9P0X715_PIEBR|nr:unnamed protein product [Pieris brassicae]